MIVGPADGSDLPELLRSVLFDNVDAILVVDAAGVVVAANPAATELFGRSMEELLGEPMGVPVQGVSQAELEVLAPGENRHVELHVGATTWRGEPASVVTLHNITDRHRADQALRDYVSMTAHEIATPLTSISGFAETLQNSWDDLDEDRRRHFAEIIGRQAKRVARISRDLLALSRLDADATDRRPSPVPVLESVRQLLDEGTIEREVVVEVDGDLTVWADPAHVGTILRNFLSNAEKYGREPIRVVATLLADEVEIAVHNAGEPVAPEFVPHLFQRFARAGRVAGHERPEGTGLGLALSAALAELNGGGVSYRDGEPDGAVFALVLPATRSTRVARGIDA